ncbi:MAG3960 family lipoprotein [Metamycoplasma alkalescens]|uniref:MAG3960 family lipoprotein n=1 Tax=Metamycoplasma alkalescens TaxID=45363 RepID=UPI003CFF0C5E
MKKLSKFLVLSTPLAFSALISISAISCWMQTPIPMPKPKPDSNDPNYRDPFPNNSNDNNNGDNNKQPNEQKDDIQPTKFEYDNIVYKIDKEDNIDYKKVYYADLVLKNNAEGFKKLLPNVETYHLFSNLNWWKRYPYIYQCIILYSKS